MSVAFRRDLTTGTPMLMFETNMPSITSTCSQSAELTRWTFAQIYCFITPNIRPELLAEEGKEAV